MAAPVVSAVVHAGSYIRTFTVTGQAIDNQDSAATAHGCTQTPIAWKCVDTTAAGAVEGDCWTVHTVGTTNFTVRKLTTTGVRTAQITFYDPHSIDR